MEGYRFRQAAAADVPILFDLILRRMKWMDGKGIRQWNVTNYDRVYPQAYYEEKCRTGELFVLESAEGEILCGAVLKERDDRWADDAPALYLHNFVSRVGAGGAGSRFLEEAESLARRMGKQFFRLDSSATNQALAEYYQSHGFLPAGTCTDGPYHGILRQKTL